MLLDSSRSYGHIIFYTGCKVLQNCSWIIINLFFLETISNIGTFNDYVVQVVVKKRQNCVTYNVIISLFFDKYNIFLFFIFQVRKKNNSGLDIQTGQIILKHSQCVHQATRRRMYFRIGTLLQSPVYCAIST